MSVSRVLVFLGILLGLTIATHHYLWIRLVRDPLLPEPWRQLATLALVVLGISIPASMLVWRLLPRSVAVPITWVGYVWMGVMFVLLVLLGTSEFLRWGWLKYASAAPADPSRRGFLSQVFAGGAMTLGLALSGWGVWSAIRPVEVKQLRIRLRNLPEKLRGFRLVQLSDIHVGPTIGKGFVDDLVRKVNDLRPDLVAITGDLVDGSVEELADAVRPLGDIQSQHGTFFVTGNHEYYSGADDWLAFLSEIGMRPLRNECLDISHNGDSLCLAGVDDWTAHQFGNGHGSDIGRALRNRHPDKPVVLLAHQPKQFEQAKAHGVDLQISGHTHGGQIFPFGFLTRLVQPFLAGLYRRGDSQIYVSSGTGYWGPPMRIMAPAEITFIELDRA